MPRFSISAGPIRIAVRASIAVSREPRSSSPKQRWTHRRLLATVLVVVAVLGGVSAASAVLVGLAVGTGHHVKAGSTGPGGRFSPDVRFTRRPPTGYTVTFRYRDPSATSVQLEGEWYFSAPGHTSPTSSQGRLPSQRKPGDIPIGWPNTSLTTAGWPVVNMNEDHATGVWSYTIPLPSGEFNYGFLLNCPSAAGHDSLTTSCPERSDPSNPPWNARDGVTVGTVEPTSQVYVPSDPVFHTVNYSWQAPTAPRGALSDVTYPQDPGSPAPPGYNNLAIYTPPRYNPHRGTPYPVVYLSVGDNEVDWSTRDDAANILDNLIDKRAIKAVVAVMTDFDFTDCQEDGQVAFGENMASSVIPYVQSHYDVSREASQRAFVGASCGGGVAAGLLAGGVRAYGYVGVISPIPATAVGAAQADALGRVRVMVGGGLQDPLRSQELQEVADLQHARVRFSTEVINGGHDWYVWRILLHDFLTRVAFKPVGG